MLRLQQNCIRFLKVNAKGEVFYVVPVPEKELSIFQVDKLKIFRVLNIIPWPDKQGGEEGEEGGEKGVQAVKTGKQKSCSKEKWKQLTKRWGGVRVREIEVEEESLETSPVLVLRSSIACDCHFCPWVGVDYSLLFFNLISPIIERVEWWGQQ